MNNYNFHGIVYYDLVLWFLYMTDQDPMRFRTEDSRANGEIFVLLTGNASMVCIKHCIQYTEYMHGFGTC